MVFLPSHHLFRAAKFVFHLLAVANLSDPLKNDPVAWTNSLLDDEDVVHFLLDHDLALMHDAILVHDVNVPLVENLVSRLLRDDDSVGQVPVDQNRAGLTVTQQALRVRKIRPERDAAGLVVELGLDRSELAGLAGTSAGSASTSSILSSCSRFFWSGLVFEVLFLGHVEVDPHHAVIGQGRENIPRLGQAAQLLVQAVDDAVERCLDVGQGQFGFRLSHLRLGLCQFGLEQSHLILRDDLSLEQALGVIELELSMSASAFSASTFAWRRMGMILNIESPFFTALALLDRNLLEIPVLRGADLDVTLRADLANIRAG